MGHSLTYVNSKPYVCMKTDELKELERTKALIKFTVMTVVYLGGVIGLVIDMRKSSLRSRP